MAIPKAPRGIISSLKPGTRSLLYALVERMTLSAFIVVLPVVATHPVPEGSRDVTLDPVEILRPLATAARANPRT